MSETDVMDALVSAFDAGIKYAHERIRKNGFISDPLYEERIKAFKQWKALYTYNGPERKHRCHVCGDEIEPEIVEGIRRFPNHCTVYCKQVEDSWLAKKDV